MKQVADSLTPWVDRGLKVPEGWVREKFTIPEPQQDGPVLRPVERISAQSADAEAQTRDSSRQPRAGLANSKKDPGFLEKTFRNDTCARRWSK